MTTSQAKRFLEKIDDSKIRDLARATYREMAECRLCPIECGANRLDGDTGPCGASVFGDVFYAGLLFNEEHDLNPAYEVFFTGCNLSCKFCYLANKVRGHTAAEPLLDHPLYDDPLLAHAKSICAVGGEPSVNLLASLYLFGTVETRPRVWNSNMYYSEFVSEAVLEVADIVVADIHFGNDACAHRIGDVLNYMDTVTHNIKKAARAGKEVIVRHLPLPGHIDCCAMPTLELAADNFADLRFHLLENYLPPSRADAGKCIELCGSIADKERTVLIEKALNVGLKLEPEKEVVFNPVSDYSGSSCHKGEEVELIIDATGKIIIPHLTYELYEAMMTFREEIDVEIRDA